MIPSRADRPEEEDDTMPKTFARLAAAARLAALAAGLAAAPARAADDLDPALRRGLESQLALVEARERRLASEIRMLTLELEALRSRGDVLREGLRRDAPRPSRGIFPIRARRAEGGRP